jgi:two-component system response regulator DegU
MNKDYQIFIADDHPIFLKGLADTINDDPQLHVTLAVKTGIEILAHLQASLPDAVVLDLDMPHKNGIDTAAEILNKHPDLPVVLLTAHKEKDLFLKALEVGIMGYVLKDNAVLDINQAIYHVIAGKAYISPEMSVFLVKRKPAKPEMQDKTALLTSTELTVLRLVAAFKSSREIADELFISEKTVSNHRMNIASKLQLTGKNSLLRFAIDELPKS